MPKLLAFSTLLGSLSGRLQKVGPNGPLLVLLCILFTVVCPPVHADDNKPGTDTLVFANGDTLKGTMVSADDSGVTFTSDMAGALTIGWDKIKTIDAMEKFAVIRNGVRLNRKTPEGSVPQGTIAIANKSIQVQTPSGTSTIATSDTQAIVLDDDFQKTLYHEPPFTHGYTGGLTLGAALVESTQNARTFNGALTLVRTVPNATWVAARNKTTLDANAIYGSTKQTATTTQAASSVKTDILHGDFERDQYITPRFYYLGYISADHDYSQGLAVQQIYGGGFGFTVIKNKVQELDVKADLHYEQQSFIPTGTPNKNLIGMDFAETYMRKLPRGIVLNETGVVTPAFNQPSAFSADFTANVLFPVYRNFGFTAGFVDNYLNDPPPTFNQNSFQFTAGLTYAFK